MLEGKGGRKTAGEGKLLGIINTMVAPCLSGKTLGGGVNQTGGREEARENTLATEETGEEETFRTRLCNLACGPLVFRKVAASAHSRLSRPKQSCRE